MTHEKTNRRFGFLHYLTDATVPLDIRISMILSMAGTIGNTLGFIANLALYGMNFPTVFCGVCALLLIANAVFGFSSSRRVFFSWAMIIMLAFLEFPLLVFTYGPVMYPYMMIGFLAMLMLTVREKHWPPVAFLAVYDVAVIIFSTRYPYIFGEQDAAGLLGSAIITFLISLGAMAGCVLTWQNVSVVQGSDIDPVSGALTRVGFLRGAEKYLTAENASDYSVLFFSIRNFRVVNSVCGIEGGNSFLREVSEKLKNSSVQPILVSRQSSDRYFCLAESAKIDLSSLNELCEIRYEGNGKEIPLVMLCGVYHVEKPGESVEEVCDKAELAGRYVRLGQQVHCHVYDEVAELTYRQETELLGELEWAIREQVFEPYYQPIVDCMTGKIVAAEALVRWNHPTKGNLKPGAFIPILEKKELISDLDRIMAEKVGSFILQQEGAGQPVVPVSVNLSRIDLFDSRLMQEIYDLITGNATLNRFVRFELTESAYEALPESTVRMLTELREKGAKILLDDFGTGYSTFSMVTDYDFDYIKLDMSFAAGLESGEKVRGIVLSLIEMAHKLGAKVIMEGVETEAQLDFLRDAGCDLIQGFLFYKPMPEEEFLRALREQRGE